MWAVSVVAEQSSIALGIDSASNNKNTSKASTDSSRKCRSSRSSFTVQESSWNSVRAFLGDRWGDNGTDRLAILAAACVLCGSSGWAEMIDREGEKGLKLGETERTIWTRSKTITRPAWDVHFGHLALRTDDLWSIYWGRTKLRWSWLIEPTLRMTVLSETLGELNWKLWRRSETRLRTGNNDDWTWYWTIYQFISLECGL